MIKFKEWIKQKLNLICCLFGFHKWEYDPDIDIENDYCINCCITRNHRENYEEV